MAPLSARHATALAVGLAVAIIAGAAVYSFAPFRSESLDTVRVGFQVSPPSHFPDAQGNPSGPVVDILNGAAARAHVHLKWVFAPEGPESALQSGKVDLWPVMGDLPERRKLFYFTAPFQKMTYLLLTPRSRNARIEDLPGKIVAFTDLSIERRLARRYLRRSTLLPVPSPLDTVRAVCEGKADAALLGQNAASSYAFPDCRITLNAAALPNGQVRFGIAATRARSDARKVADRLRTEIGNMAHDGSLAGLDFKWGTNIGGESQAISDFTSARLYSRVLLVALGLLGVSIVGMAVQARNLRRAKKQAIAANLAKSEFLANMSHEIRTPMNGVTGMIHLALGTRDVRQQREFLTMAQDSASSLLSIINDILDFSKIEAGKLSLDPEPFEVRAFLDQVLRPFAPKAAEQGLQLRHEVDESVPKILIGDSGRLRQMIVNLVSNAMKFTPQGEVVVRVSAQPIAGGSQFEFQVAVSDTGVGISTDRRARVLEPYTQAEASTTRKYGGTGLGLTICTRLARLMDGELHLESALGAGTTVRFTARLGRPECPPVPTDPALRVSPELRGSSGPLRILVAEDNQVNRRLAQRLLEKNGHTVKLACTGTEAVLAYLDFQPDLILMDVEMPELDGHEATRQIREIELTQARRHTPIVAMTARAMTGDREKCLAAGMDAYVSKPLDIAELLQHIQDLGVARPTSRQPLTTKSLSTNQ